jgi:hypothetical protein
MNYNAYIWTNLKNNYENKLQPLKILFFCAIWLTV